MNDKFSLRDYPLKAASLYVSALSFILENTIEEGKYANIKELSAKINIGTRRIQQILRLNYLAPKIKEDIVNGRQPRDLKLVDLREIPMLWSEQLEKFYGLIIYKSNRKSMCQKELLQRATQKDVEIDIEEQINVTKSIMLKYQYK
ncbi:UNVERIFIED_CONTAM: hypothetical protein LBW93_04230 [Wolbachia endosymbiont of Nasonia longicornis]